MQYFLNVHPYFQGIVALLSVKMNNRMVSLWTCQWPRVFGKFWPYALCHLTFHASVKANQTINPLACACVSSDVHFVNVSTVPADA